MSKNKEMNEQNNFKSKKIEIVGDGFRMKGEIIQVKENKHEVIIIYKDRWNEINEFQLYHDEYEELYKTKKTKTIDSDVHVK